MRAGDAGDAPGLMAREIADWEALYRSAALSQLRPQVAQWASAAGGIVPDDIASVLRADALAHSGRGGLLAGEMLAVLDALGANGIRAFPFKGPAFAHLVLEGQARECNDIDIFVDAANLREAIPLLLGLGYAPALSATALESPWLTMVSSDLGMRNSRSGILLEVHWRTAPPWYRPPIDAADVFATLAENEIFGCSILWPASAELVLLHVADGMKSGGWGLRWLADLVALLRAADRVDWERLRAVAQSRGAMNNVRVAIALACDASESVAEWIGVPGSRLDLPPMAQQLALEGGDGTRIAAAKAELVARLAADVAMERPLEHFRWALRIADQRSHAIGGILGYLWRPAVADLEFAATAGGAGLGLRTASWMRRLRALAA